MLGFGLPSLFAGRQHGADDIRKYITAIERAGATAISVGDHMNWHVACLECLSLLSYVAALTSLPLVSNVLVLPLREPFVAIKMAATIAYLAQGRFTLGVGVGGEHPREFEAVGVSVEERASRTDEWLDVLHRLLAGGPVTHHGRHYHLTNAHLDPLPRMDVLIGGRSQAALRRVVRAGDGWTAAWVRPHQFAERREAIQQLAEQAGRQPDELRMEVHTRVTLGGSVEDAWADAEPFLRRLYGTDPEPFRGHTQYGPPDVVAEKLHAFLETKPDRLYITFNGNDQLAQLEWFIRDVQPLLHSAGMAG